VWRTSVEGALSIWNGPRSVVLALASPSRTGSCSAGYCALARKFNLRPIGSAGYTFGNRSCTCLAWPGCGRNNRLACCEAHGAMKHKRVYGCLSSRAPVAAFSRSYTGVAILLPHEVAAASLVPHATPS